MIKYLKNSIKNYLIKQKYDLFHCKNNNMLNIKYIGKKTIIYNCELNGKISIGNSCMLNNSFIRGKVEIGNYSSINGPTTFINAKHNHIMIGNYCSIAHNVTIMEFFHNTETLSTSFLNKKIDGKLSFEDTWSKGSIEIGSDVWIGAGVTILSGVKIGNGAIIGANSVVNKDVPDFAIVVGNPARIIKYRFEKEIIDELLKIKWWEYDLERLKSIKHLLGKKLNREVLNEIKSKL